MFCITFLQTTSDAIKFAVRQNYLRGRLCYLLHLCQERRKFDSASSPYYQNNTLIQLVKHVKGEKVEVSPFPCIYYIGTYETGVFTHTGVDDGHTDADPKVHKRDIRYTLGRELGAVDSRSTTCTGAVAQVTRFPCDIILFN